MDRAFNKLKKLFKQRSRNQSLYSQVEDYDYLDDMCMRARPYIDDEVRSNHIDLGGIAHYDSVLTLEDNQVLNVEEIVPVVDENLYCEIEESASAIMIDDTPYVMVGELSCTNQENVNFHSEVEECAGAIIEDDTPYVMVGEFSYSNQRNVNLYGEVEESARAIIEDDTPYVMVGELSYSNQRNVNLHGEVEECARALIEDDTPYVMVGELSCSNQRNVNFHSEIEESASAVMEDDTPYVMVGELSRSNQRNVNVYSEVEEIGSASTILEHDTPYVMASEHSCSSEGNVSQIICSLIKERFKDKLNNLENTYETLPENVDDDNIVPSISESLEFAETLDELKKELKIQQNIIVQSNKALEISAQYNFNGKIEEMEARRFLLIAETRRNMLEERIQNLNLELEGNGVVKFKNFKFSKKSMNLKLSKMFKKQKSETRLWFMILVSYGKVLSANRVIEESDYIMFEDELVFERLLVDFDISMYLYSVSLKKESKKKCGKSIENYWDLVAKFDFIKENLKLNNFLSDEVSDRCPLSGAFEVEVQTDVQIDDVFSAFLDVKTHWKGENSWSRSWCILKGSNLMFYKYPGDEESFYIIDLRKCKKVDQPDRAECPRRKSLVLQTKIGNGVSSDYISADSWELINEWERNIKNVLQLLKDWC